MNNAAADNNLYDEIAEELSSLSPSLRKIALSVHGKIKQADRRGEISNVNRTFYESMKPEYQSQCNIDPNSLKLLDKANVYTWLTYTLIDDVIDERDTSLASTANTLMRLTIACYVKSGIEIDYINSVFLTVDTANQQELVFRLRSRPDIKKLRPLLYKKSIAHCLGQMWLVQKLNIQNIEGVLEGFENYCSARQLNDDIFDWRDDIANNQKTYATELLQDELSRQSSDIMNLNKKDRLNIAFWHSGLEHLCDEVGHFAALSANQLSVVLNVHSTYIDSFIEPLGALAKKSKEIHLMEKKKLNLDSSGITAP